MAVQSNLKNMAIVLSAVCFVCSALLAITFAATLEPINTASVKALQKALGEVLPEGGQIDVNAKTLTVDGVSYDYFTQTASDGSVNAWAIQSTTSGFGGGLTVLVGITADNLIYSTKVLSHSETPGLGAKCQSDESFLGQFRGFNPSTGNLSVRKDGGDIDAITASTITSRAYSLAVANAVKVANELQNNRGNE